MRDARCDAAQLQLQLAASNSKNRLGTPVRLRDSSRSVLLATTTFSSAQLIVNFGWKNSWKRVFIASWHNNRRQQQQQQQQVEDNDREREGEGGVGRVGGWAQLSRWHAWLILFSLSVSVSNSSVIEKVVSHINSKTIVNLLMHLEPAKNALKTPITSVRIFSLNWSHLAWPKGLTDWVSEWVSSPAGQ